MNFEPAQTNMIQTYTAWRDDFQDVALTPPNLCSATITGEVKRGVVGHTLATDYTRLFSDMYSTV
jgi:hypothetical protein